MMHLPYAGKRTFSPHQISWDNSDIEKFFALLSAISCTDPFTNCSYHNLIEKIIYRSQHLIKHQHDYLQGQAPRWKPHFSSPSSGYALVSIFTILMCIDYRISSAATKLSPIPTTSKTLTTSSTKLTAGELLRAQTTSISAPIPPRKKLGRISMRARSKSLMWLMGSD